MPARPGPPRPLIVFAVPGAVARDALAEAAHARYDHRYRVLTTSGQRETAQALLELAAQGCTPALVVAELRLPDGDGIRLLTQSADWAEDVRRVLLAPVGDSETAAVAIAAGKIDRHVATPLNAPEDALFPVLDDLLFDWEVPHGADGPAGPPRR